MGEEGSLIGKILDCDSKDCEFESRPSPILLYIYLLFKICPNKKSSL